MRSNNINLHWGRWRGCLGNVLGCGEAGVQLEGFEEALGATNEAPVYMLGHGGEDVVEAGAYKIAAAADDKLLTPHGAGHGELFTRVTAQAQVGVVGELAFEAFEEAVLGDVEDFGLACGIQVGADGEIGPGHHVEGVVAFLAGEEQGLLGGVAQGFGAVDAAINDAGHEDAEATVVNVDGTPDGFDGFGLGWGWGGDQGGNTAEEER